MAEKLRCPKCGAKNYRVENFDGKAFCQICREAFQENRLDWLRRSHAELLAACMLAWQYGDDEPWMKPVGDAIANAKTQAE